MASTIDDKKKVTTEAAPVAEQSTPAAATEAASSAAQPSISPYTGLAGLSDQTSQKLGQYSQGYQASDAVNAAQQYLNNVVSGKPGDYQSQYQGQLESLYNQIMNRDPFSFDLNGDALYNQYKDQYTQMGQQAMMDTMGQASALTGGYGNSYAQTAGQQAYQNYLAQLNNIVPDLYQMAYDRYNQEGTNLQNKLGLTQGLEDSAYGKYRDTVSDWNAERAYASEDYWNKYNADYSDYANMLNYWNTVAQQENSQYNTDKQAAYNQAMAILKKGLMPTADLLAKAGITNWDAKQIAGRNGSSGGGGGSSGGRKSSGDSYNPGGNNGGDTTEQQINSMSELSSNAKSVWYETSGGSGYSADKMTGSRTKDIVSKALNSGKINNAEADYILRKRGY